MPAGEDEVQVLSHEGLLKRVLRTVGMPVACRARVGVAALCALGGLSAATATPASASPAVPQGLPATVGYWVVNRAGGVAAAGGAPELGGLGPQTRLARPVVAMAAAPGGTGYWLASANGAVYSFGSAGYYGAVTSERTVHLSGRVVGMAAAPKGNGYWLASSDGSVYGFGHAPYLGRASLASPPHRSGHVTDRVVAIAATPEGAGYWLVTSRGSVYSFGRAKYWGSATGLGLTIVGLAPTPDGRGYWISTSSGRVVAFGDARVVGAPQRSPSGSFVGFAAERDGRGHWLARPDGTVLGYGQARRSSAAALAHAAVAVVADPAVVVPAAPVRAAAGASVRVAAAVAASPEGQAVVKFALAQAGKPYQYGSAGPGSYDCSGLAQASWAVAGVALPRTAAEQYYSGAHVPLSALQPGDLIFWASDPADPSTIYHVAISLGGDETVQATEPGGSVRVMPIWTGGGLVPLATRP
ncbi:MAG TPA: NlpC/P60 family protein [Acidimicrobiales bacterium]|nr:NlpC/P60 family protein [Acidimicrobiales bacterium]